MEVDINKKQSNTEPNIIEEDATNTTQHKEVDIEINSSNVKYVQKFDRNINYGFYPIDRAAHQYLYAFVVSKDGGVIMGSILFVSCNQ